MQKLTKLIYSGIILTVPFISHPAFGISRIGSAHFQMLEKPFKATKLNVNGFTFKVYSANEGKFFLDLKLVTSQGELGSSQQMALNEKLAIRKNMGEFFKFSSWQPREESHLALHWVPEQSAIQVTYVLLDTDDGLNPRIIKYQYLGQFDASDLVNVEMSDSPSSADIALRLLVSFAIDNLKWSVNESDQHAALDYILKKIDRTQKQLSVSPRQSFPVQQRPHQLLKKCLRALS